MGESESGAKWWIRYVVVPLIGGGGLIALIVAGMDNRQKTVPPSNGAAQNTVSAVSPPIENKENSPPSAAGKPTEDGAKLQRVVKPSSGTAQPGKPEPLDPVQSLTVKDEEYATQFTGRNLLVDWGTKWRVRWKVNAQLLQGSLVRRYVGPKGAVDENSIAADDSEVHNCPTQTDGAAEEQFDLIDLLNDGTRHSVATVHVHCRAN